MALLPLLKGSTGSGGVSLPPEDRSSPPRYQVNLRGEFRDPGGNNVGLLHQRGYQPYRLWRVGTGLDCGTLQAGLDSDAERT